MCKCDRMLALETIACDQPANAQLISMHYQEKPVAMMMVLVKCEHGITEEVPVPGGTRVFEWLYDVTGFKSRFEAAERYAD